MWVIAIPHDHMRIPPFHGGDGGLNPPGDAILNYIGLEPSSGEVEPVKVHNLIPRRYKVVHELPLGVLTPIDFREGP